MNRASSPALLIEVLDRESAIARLPNELAKLAARALESNIFYEPLMFIPALQLLDVDVPLSIVCIRNKSGRLLGVVPLVVAPLRAGLPVKVLRNWVHRYCYLGTPLIDAHAAHAVLEALASWLGTRAAPARALQWVNISWDGRFGRLLQGLFGPGQTWAMDATVARRATLERALNFKPPISGKHAKELRRLERRLAAQGAVEYAVLQNGEPWRPWYERFVALEARGWKGARGSAIGSKTQDEEFFRRVVQHAHAAGRLQMMQLSVGGTPVAMKLNLRGADTAYSLKIAHDETYAPYSPGVLLELFNVKAFEREPAGIARMDSCAAADHPMINRLWPARREIATVTLARHGVLLRTLVKLRPMARRLRRITQPAAQSG